jgi:hypothetical protein
LIVLYGENEIKIRLKIEEVNVVEVPVVGISKEEL